MAGKNHIERSFRIQVDDSGGTARDLSGDLVPGSLQGGGITFDQADMTGVSETVRNYLAGHGEAPITAQFHMNDTATTGSSVVLNAIAGQASTVTVTLQWGQAGAAPTSSDPEWEGEYVCLANAIQLNGNTFVYAVSFMPSGSTAPAWGTVA